MPSKEAPVVFTKSKRNLSMLFGYGSWFLILVTLQPSFVSAVVLFFVCPIVAAMVLAMVDVNKRASAPKDTTLGSATFATPSELLATHVAPKGYFLEDSHGLALGRLDCVDPAKYDQRYRYTGHVLTLAPTGAGKGIGAAIPNLLDYPGSCLVLDVKGENWAVTHNYRENVLGHQVIAIDPFNVTGGGSGCYNPIHWLDQYPDDIVPDALMLADALVIGNSPSGSDITNHFDDSARNLIQGLIVYVYMLDDENRRTLGEVRNILTSSAQEFEVIMSLMAESSTPIVKRTANNILATEERERSSILSTARRHTAFLDDDRVTRLLSRTTFDLSHLKSEMLSVYLIIPPEKILTYSRLLRLMISIAITGITRTPGKAPLNTLFLLDEVAQLGNMSILESSISIMRGYGAMYWLFFQDLSQIKAVYPKWQTFLANCTKQVFGTADYDTARYISDTIGQETVVFYTQGSGDNDGSSFGKGGISYSAGDNRNVSEHVQARSLLTPDEVMAMPRDKLIIMSRGERPAVLTRLNYLSDPEYVGCAEDNPLHGG